MINRKRKMNKTIFIKTVLIFSTLLNCFVVRAFDDGKELYESTAGMCSKCNCTTTDGTLEDGESGKLFSLDCSMKSFQRLFTGWPEEMGDNSTDLEIIFMMSQNHIQHLQQFPSTDAKIIFTCRHCKISGIASHAFIDTPNIFLLDLSYNEITSSELFPEIFKGPDSDDEYAPIKLESLDLSHNKIDSLEKLLFEHVPHLKTLVLGHNTFNKFDEPTEHAIGSLHKLEILDLSFTGIMELTPNMLKNLEKLRELFLGGNKLLTVPESLSFVGKSLKNLILKENPIETINDESFVGLSKLEQLNISGLPELIEIKENSLKDLKSLEVFHCRGNKKLKEFHMGNLREMKYLKDLDVSNNALSVLDFGEIDISKNVENLNGEDPDKKYENQFKNLRVLKLAGNPWNCDCSIMKSLSVFDHSAKYFNKSINKDEARCKSPSELSSKLLYHLPEDYVCASHSKLKEPRIPIYDPPQFLRPKSILLTVFSVVGVVVLGIIIGFAIVCVKRRLKESETGYTASPIRYTTVRNSTVSNVANSHYSP